MIIHGFQNACVLSVVADSGNLDFCTLLFFRKDYSDDVLDKSFV
jgi:hypothetical protein